MYFCILQIKTFVHRIVDIPPLAASPMHRTVGVYYSVDLEGEVPLELE